MCKKRFSMFILLFFIFSIFPVNNVVTWAADTLSAPTALTALPANQSSGPIISLSWKAVAGADKYKIYRSEDEGNTFTEIKTSTATNYIDTSVEIGRSYLYKVSSMYLEEESEKTEVVSAKVYEPTYKFDFGEGYSDSLEPGYTEVFFTSGSGKGLNKSTTKYSESRGYGFTATVSGRTRGTNGTPLQRDFAIPTKDTVFKVKLDPGNYSFNFISGSLDTKNDTGAGSIVVSFSGNTTSTSISYAKGEVVEKVAYASVKDSNPLEIYFGNTSNQKLNGLIITPIVYAPTDLATTEVNGSSKPAYVSLVWNGTSDALSYNIYRKALEEDIYTKMGSTMEASFKDSTVVVGKTYSYFVSSVTTNGEANSLSKNVEVTAEASVAPEVPTGFTANRSNSSVVLSWTKSDEALAYNIFRKTSADSEYKQITTIDATNAVSSMSYTDENLSRTLNYYYNLTAVNKGGESQPASVVATAPVPQMPSPVEVEKVGWSVVELISTAGDDATGCRVYISESLDGNYTLLSGNATKIQNTYRYKSTGLEPSKDYYFKFAAFNEGGESEKTAPIKITTKKIIEKPEAPSELKLTSIKKSGSSYSIRIDWKFSYGATSYNVYRATNIDGNYVKIGTSTNGVYTDTNSSAEGTINYYKVSALNVSGESKLSEPVAAKMTSNFKVAPTGLSVSNLNYSSTPSLDLSWTKVEGAKIYNIYRALKIDNLYSKIGTSDTETFTDKTAIIGNEYLYKVNYEDENGESKKSSALSYKFYDTNAQKTQAPTGLTYSYENNGALKLSWNPVEGAITYSIYKTSIKDKKYTYVGSSKVNSFTDNNPAKGAVYYYTVTALNAGGESNKASSIEIAPKVEFRRQMEKINRGVHAVKVSNGVYINWRFLGIDSSETGFNIYRDGVKINLDPITTSTNYLDSEGKLDSKYYITAVVENEEIEKSETISVLENNYMDVPIKKPPMGKTPSGEVYDYTANDASVADLDGDGEYEIVLKWQPTNSHDNSESGYTGNTYIDAYELDGTFMWRIDLGKNIRAGAHYTDMMVYDFDGDGKAEIAVKTADGTIDGQGNIIGDEDKDYRNSSGYILNGPEYHTMFEGATGKAIVTEPYEPQRGVVSDWGDNYGNRVDRFLAGVAYLDGKTPSLIEQRGYYTRMVITAYNFKDSKFIKLWTFDTDYDEVDSNGVSYSDYEFQGNHQMSIGDVDGDGMDEIVTGPATIDHDGKALATTKLGHGDAMHLGDLDPNRPGLELFQVHEDYPSKATELHDPATGEIIWSQKGDGDVGRGLSADIDPRYLGEECWSNGTYKAIYTVTGEKISSSVPSTNFAIWWDGDLSRELLNHDSSTSNGVITKWDYENNKNITILTAEGTVSNNNTKANPALQADLFGDWREEAIWRLADSSALRIYSTTDVTDTRIYTLMHDPLYRLGVAWQNTGYNQPPHTSFYLGTGMSIPKQPNITMLGGGEEVEIGVEPNKPAFNVSSNFNLSNLEPNRVINVETSVTNNTTVEKDVLVIIALYDESDKMINVTYISKNIAADITDSLKSGFRLPEDITGHKIKVFVWEGKDIYESNIQPISNVITFK